MTISLVRSISYAPGTSALTQTVAFDATGCDALVIGIRDTGTTSLITSVTYNGVVTTLKRHDGTSERGSSIYVITGIPSGTHDVVVTYSSSANFGMIVSGFSGVDQVTPVGNTNGRSDTSVGGSGSNVPVSITCTAGNVVVDFFVATSATLTSTPAPAGTQTLTTPVITDGGGFAYDGSSYLLNATSMAWILTGPSAVLQSHSLIELKAGSASTVTGVTVSPSTATVSGGATQSFTATVAGTGSPSQSVNWTTTAGSINSSGLFTAPAATGSSQTITVTATSVQNGSFAGTATITVPASSSTVTGVTVSPGSASVVGGATQNFTATVAGTGSPSQSVNWTTTSGSITSGGVFTAPAATGSIQTVTVTATSVQNGSFAGTATVTVPAAVSPVLSSSFASVLPKSINYADRVKDTSTTTGSGTLILSNSSAAGFQTFGVAFSVGTKNVAYYIVGQSGGEWEGGLGTLVSSTTLSRDTILASSNGGSPVVFSSGTKDVFCSLPAALIKRLAAKSHIDLRDYDIDPTFTYDSTAAIQSAINDAFLSGVQKIVAPVGHYKIAGPLITSDGFGRTCNGQLYIPASYHVSAMKSIQIVGDSPTSWGYGAINDEPITSGGVIFESTISGSGTLPAVIYSSVGFDGGWGLFNFTDFYLENVCIRTNTASGANSMCGINLYNSANGGFLNNVKVEVNRGLRTNPDPSGVGSIGIITARTDNSGAFKWGNVFVGGYCTGVRFYEHMSIERLTVYGCLNAVDLQATHHASNITHLDVERCKNSVVINGNHDLAVLCYSCEHGTPGWWADFAYDIKYVSGSRKVTILQSTAVVGGVGISDAAFSTNATSANYKIVAGSGAN